MHTLYKAGGVDGPHEVLADVDSQEFKVVPYLGYMFFNIFDHFIDICSG